MTAAPDPLADRPFDYRATKDGRVRISFRGKVVTTLAAREAERFLSRTESADARGAQLLMAKATGHFKHGTERVSKERGKP